MRRSRSLAFGLDGDTHYLTSQIVASILDGPLQHDPHHDEQFRRFDTTFDVPLRGDPHPLVYQEVPIRITRQTMIYHPLAVYAIRLRPSVEIVQIQSLRAVSNQPDVCNFKSTENSSDTVISVGTCDRDLAASN